jgi:hypothetical protein
MVKVEVLESSVGVKLTGFGLKVAIVPLGNEPTILRSAVKVPPEPRPEPLLTVTV